MAINRIKTGGITDNTIQSGDLAPGTIASDRIAPGTIANDRLANNTITINGTSIALGASGDIVAGTDWQSVTVADGSTTLNATAGAGYFLDTNAGVIEVFLPSSPTQGDTVTLVDYAGTFATNNVIVNTGGVAIDSTVGSDFILSTNNRIAEFVYVDSNKGWLYKGATTRGSTPSQAGAPVYDSDLAYISATGGTVTESGDYKIHTFTGDGCFVVSQTGLGEGPNVVDYLVVAGGGGSGGGSNDGGGGGGAGGFRLSNSTCMPAPLTSPLANPTGITLSVTTYPITVGAGGAGSSCYAGGSKGSDSIFSTITSAGGGVNNAAPGTPSAPTEGGSAAATVGGLGTGSPANLGNRPPVSPPQGNNSGTSGGTSPNNQAGGGGGAGAVGANGTPSGGGQGGAGSYVVSTGFAGCNGTTGPVGSARYFAAGGGGGARMTGASAQPIGGGGQGSSGDCGPSQSSTSGTANTGSGGGGGAPKGPTGGSGGKGIVIIRYKFQ